MSKIKEHYQDSPAKLIGIINISVKQGIGDNMQKFIVDVVDMLLELQMKFPSIFCG